MAVPAGPTEKRYTGNGVTMIFPIPFLLITASDLDVFIDGVEVVSGFTITGAGNPTSTITFSVPPANLSSILLTLNVPFERLNDYQENGDFLASTVNRDFDRIWQALKQLLRGSVRALTLGTFDVDGAGWYRAKGNGIRDLKDPELDQDAVTKRWSILYITNLLSAITGPINNALNIFYKGPDGLNYVVQDIADTTDPAKGASLVGWFQAGVGAIRRTVGSKLRELVSTSDFGSIDNNSTDNTPSINSTKSFVGTGGVSRLTRRAGGIFKFNTPFDLNGIVIDNDPGLTLSVTQSVFNVITSAPARVTNKLRLYFSDMNAEYPLYPLPQEDLAEKRIWLDDVNADLSYRESLALNGLRFETLSWPAGDTWAPATNYAIGNNGGLAPYINWSGGSPNNWYRSSFPVRVGDEVTANFPTGGVFNRVCFVQHSGGYFALYATGVNGTLKYVRKDLGVAPVENDVGVGDVLRTQPQYYAESSVWCVKILTRRQFIILLNGHQVGGVLQSPGDIMRAGFGYMPQAVTSVSISGFVRTRKGKVGGRARQDITVFGDSTWIEQHGGSMDPLRKALYGMGGTTVGSITNLAVAGTNAADMLLRMQTLGFNGNTVLIGLLTNDIQGQTDVPTFLNTVLAMFVLARLNAQTIVVAGGRMWYDRTTAAATTGFANQGQGSSNSANGAYYRCCLEHLCADQGVKYVDLTRVSGPIDSNNLIATSGVDRGVWDSIHKTPYLATAEAIACAKAIFGEYSGGISRRAEVQALPIVYSAGWSAYPSAPEVAQMLWTEDGRLDCMGKITSPTGAVPNGTQAGLYREDQRPIVPWAGELMTSLGPCQGFVSLAGELTVAGFPTGATWLDISNIRFVTYL